jgi:CelD/BcsL family acetyltransferase involved in cellulose biosynthesis
MNALSIDVVRPDQLSGSEVGAWRAFVWADPRLESPFFSPDYAAAAGRLAPGAAVAILRRDGRATGFLPYQRRGRALQPLAAPISDYHGLILSPEETASPAEVLRRLSAARYNSTAWVGPPPQGRVQVRRSMHAVLDDGFEAWRKARSKANGSLKDKARRLRGLERDHGPPVFALHDPDPSALEWLLARKRSQYRATAQHDVFACGWTSAVLRALVEARRPDFGGTVSTLRIGGRLIAAEFALRDARTHHLWFPAYDPAYAKYSPGALLLIEAMRQAADEGITRIDFGPDLESYKGEFADPGQDVYEGVLLRSPKTAPIRGSATDRWTRWRFRIERRLGVIRACEADRLRAAAAAAASISAYGMKRMAGPTPG